MAMSQWLAFAVNYLASQGYRITSQADFQVQMLKPKQKSCFLIVVLLLLGVIPGLVYLALSTDKSILLFDTGHSIQSNQGGRKNQEATYEDLAAGRYNKLLKKSFPALVWALFTLFVIFIGFIVIVVNS